MSKRTTVKELKELLENYEDDDSVYLEHTDWISHADETDTIVFRDIDLAMVVSKKERD